MSARKNLFHREPVRGPMRIARRLVLALDVTDARLAASIAEATRGHVDAVKVGWPLVLAAGLGIVSDLSRHGYILCDFKVADIPNTNRLIVEQAVAAGAGGIICQGFPGEDSVRACVDAAGRADVFVLTEMSHPGGVEFTAKHAEDFARIAMRAGASGIIAPATRPERVKALRAIVGDLLILTPGVGAQGGSPAAPLLAGADAIIVGRAIYEAERPAEAAKSEERRVGKECRSA